MASKHVSLANRCAESKSPYVRSHMTNPTAWQLWEPATFALAQQTNRLLFVSIGYSACHWCHVMAHESFDDPRIAQLLNEYFIPVKIDREERPDIDRQYMDFQQATNGSGGWPLNVFVTPDLEPVFSGTYWPGPKSQRVEQMGGAGFEQILLKVSTMWKEQETKVRQSGKDVIKQLQEFAQEGSLKDGEEGEEDGLEFDVVGDAYTHHKNRFDEKYGGFGAMPKFPTPVHLRALLRFGLHPQLVRDIVGDEEVGHARHMTMKTLEHMAKGGIKDQIGHGFARYSVTRDWSLPHFEKMLYDNAQLLSLYLDAYLVTKSPLFQEMVEDVATYLTTEPIVSPLGAFHASEDADSLPAPDADHKLEGAYYVWTLDEFRTVLGEKDAKIAAKYWSVKPNGNVDSHFDQQGELVGKNTLSVSTSISSLAAESSLTEAEITSILQESRRKLLSYREAHRPRPALDDKIVTAWNGLAIGSLARAGASLSKSDYIAAAERAASCIRTHLFDPSTSTLIRIYREGPGSTPGFADDYAFLIAGLLDLYEATFNTTHLSFADTLQKTQNHLFWDTTTPSSAAFFSTPANQPDILVRTKDAMDGAEPSVNAVSASNLFRLGSLLDDAEYTRMARRTVAAFEVEIGQHPGLFSGMMANVIASKLGIKGLMVVGEGEVVRRVLEKIGEGVRPNWTVLRVQKGSEEKGLEWLRGRNGLVKEVDAGRELVQLCEEGTCRVLDREAVERLF